MHEISKKDIGLRMSRAIIVMILGLLVLSCTQPVVSYEEEEESVDPYVYKWGSLRQGETLANALLDRELGNADVYRVVNELNEVYDLRRCYPGDSFFVKVDTTNLIQELQFIPDRVTSYHVIRDTLGEYQINIEKNELEKEVSYIEGEIETSLYAAIIKAGEGPALAMALTQIFQWDIDFLIDPQKGDQFRLVFEKYKSGDEFIRYGDILTAQYVSRNYDKIAYLYTTNEGQKKYFDIDGQSFQKAFLRSPLNYTRITSRFSRGRYHPVLKIVRPHHGVDYGAPHGTPVETSADGTVIHVGWKGGHPTVNGRQGGYGKTVMIRHPNGYQTLYGHLSNYARGLKVGQRVSQGQVIGYVGSTGLATGPHLHYEIHLNGNPIDPLKLDNVAGPPVPENELAQFKAKADSLYALLNSRLIVEKTEDDADKIVEEEQVAMYDAEQNRAWFWWVFIGVVVLFIIRGITKKMQKRIKE